MSETIYRDDYAADNPYLIWADWLVIAAYFIGVLIVGLVVSL